MPENFIIRKAQLSDLPDIVKLLAEDDLGNTRESNQLPLPNEYEKAFKSIIEDMNNELVVMEKDSQIIGTLQITLLQYLTYKGSKRAQIEAVRIKNTFRGEGLGKQLLDWAINRAKEMNCHMVQLTTNKTRDKAIKFYIDLGFTASHEGMKLFLK